MKTRYLKKMTWHVWKVKSTSVIYYIVYLFISFYFLLIMCILRVEGAIVILTKLVTVCPSASFISKFCTIILIYINFIIIYIIIIIIFLKEMKRMDIMVLTSIRAKFLPIHPRGPALKGMNALLSSSLRFSHLEGIHSKGFRQKRPSWCTAVIVRMLMK